MKPEPFSFKKRIKSFVYALAGIRSFFLAEQNAWLHLLATILVVVLAWWTDVSRGEWLAILLVVGLVWITEIINSCIERLVDLVSPGYNKQAKQIKDMAAAAVLAAAVIALVTGLYIFIPYLIQ